MLKLLKSERNKTKIYDVSIQYDAENELYIVIYNSGISFGKAQFTNNEDGKKLMNKFLKLLER